MKPSDILTDKTKWTQGALARDAQGIAVPETSPDAVCWCLEGAILRASGAGCYPFTPVRDAWFDLVPHIEEVDNSYRPCDWNDDPRRTFDEVRSALLAAGL